MCWGIQALGRSRLYPAQSQCGNRPRRSDQRDVRDVIKRVIADGNLVAVHVRGSMRGLGPGIQLENDVLIYYQEFFMANKQRFHRKNVLVLGGNSGIGLAASRQFADEGGKLVITGRNPETLKSAAASMGAHAVCADMGDVNQTERVMHQVAQEFGLIDVLFVNAGIGGFSPVPDVTQEFWDEVHNVNLRGAFFAIQQALPVMRDSGSIVITGSIGSQMPLEGNVVYAAAKAGLRAMARVVAKELVPRGIRVNLVSPGPVDTEIFKREASAEQIEAQKKAMSAAVPIGRLGQSDEIANAVLFLASDEASFINGVDLYVDGGCIELS